MNTYVRLCSNLSFTTHIGLTFSKAAGEEETADPTDEPGMTRKLSKKGSALKLKCIGKQESDENPLMRRAIARNAIPPSSLPTVGDDLDKSTNHISPGMSMSTCFVY